ncbi:hypothetical protein AALP_AAs57609U000200 [Arabis alpina]|uniref:Uncharacterized protein n=1 Tax=Arabis alpina TaxID=50452 RepID=A0A087G0P8_ARAAL|nr:hypothetical protein AALP_AAs57609U000200 [Arabis alpina]
MDIERENQVEERVRVYRNLPEERDNQVEERVRVNRNPPEERENQVEERVRVNRNLPEERENQVEERVRVNRNPPEERDNQVEERGWFVVNQVHATILGCFLLAIVFLPIVAAFAQGGFTDTTPSTTINGTRSHNAFPLSSLPAFGYSFGVYITIHLAEVHINPEHHTAKIWLDYLSIICACVAMIALVHVVFPLFALCFLTPLGAFALVVRGVIIAMTPIRYIWIVCKLCILNRRLKNKLFMEREASRLLTTAIDGTTRDVTQALVNTLKVEMASLDREINGLKRETGVVVADEEAQVVRDGGVRA